MSFNPLNVVRLLLGDLAGTYIESEPSNKELEARDYIMHVLTQYESSPEIAFETETTLDTMEEFQGGHELGNIPIDDCSDSDDEDEELAEAMGGLSTQSEASMSSPVKAAKRPKLQVSFEYKEKAIAFWKNEKDGQVTTNRAFSAVQNRHKKLKSREQLYDWQKQVDQKGSRIDILNIIWKATFETFESARRNNLTVHDADLKRWAIETAKNQQHQIIFKASNSWLRKFKKHYRVCGRKVTKFVSRNYCNELDDIEMTAMNFVHETKEKIMDYYEGNVYNSDQSGFNKEMHSGRSLAFKGQRKVLGTAQSASAMTHSYTIMPTISMSGELLSPLYIVLQEAGGVFGPLVIQSMYKAPNLFVDATRSGKMGKKELVSWLKNGFFPGSGEKNALLVDSWSTFSDRSAIISTIPDDKTLDIFQIPAKTTGIAQPLDVYGFRPYKHFVKKISDRVLLEQLDFNLFTRNNILKLQSFVHNQFCSPRYKSLFLLSWYKSGYIDERPPRFIHPSTFFASGCDLTCESDECMNGSFGKCSWCKMNFCFYHTIETVHYCSNYIE
jgi:hypothetical protein